MNSEESIFAQALRQPTPSARAAFLDGACAEHPQLRREIDALLTAHDRAGEGAFLESPPTAVLHPHDAPTRVTPPALERPGAVVGPYKLLQQLGEGGMGVVFMAEQLRPVRRMVAVKIIKPGLDTRQVIARFEAERQALAMMEHPNIAKVFDAGSTDTGRPYFVMELVRGVPITDYCDQHHLTPRQRLELFVQVCRAVQHAHTKGVIHRDLKPSNVLITHNDGDKPTPKVIDFGIAKATAGQRLTELTLVTEFRQLVGTPLYMSPEQAEMSAVLDVDTRSDIYSLGVLLYELLTGTTPFDKQRLAKAAFDEVRRILREEEPPRPSTRISTLGETLTSISIQRHTDGKRLGQLVRGELDWIVMRAMEKERNRRYETANGLARDVERYLSDQPVEASPPSRVYRLRKFATRNRAALTTAAAITAALIGATAVSTWQAIRAHRASIEARQETEKQTAINQFLQQLLGSANQNERTATNNSKGPDITMREVLEHAVQELDAGSFKQRPEIEAAVRRTVALVLPALGMRGEAEKQMSIALRLDEQVYGPDSAAVADRLIHLGNWTGQDGKLAEGEAMLRKGLLMQRKYLDDHDPVVINSMCLFAATLLAEKKYAEDEQLCREAVAICERFPPEQDAPLSQPLHELARVLQAQNKFAEAEPLLKRAMVVQRRIRGADYPLLQDMLLELCDVLDAQRKFADAELECREFLKIQPQNLTVMIKLVDLLGEQSKRPEASAAVAQTLATAKAQLDPTSEASRGAIWLLAKTGAGLEKAGMPAEGEPLLRYARANYHGGTWNVVLIMGWLQDALQREGKTDEAASIRHEAIPVIRQAVAAEQPGSPHQANVIDRLASYLESDHQLAEAERQYRQALAIRRKCGAESGPDVLNAVQNLSGCLFAEKQTAEILNLWRERAALLQAQLAAADTPARQGPVYLALGQSLMNCGEFDQAKSVIRKLLELDSAETRDAELLNNIAWTFATNADPAAHDHRLALQAAEKAVRLKPAEGGYWNTLGVARYRSADYAGAIDALLKSRQLQQDKTLSWDAFFLSMAHWQLGQHDEARAYYHLAVDWMQEHAPDDEELHRFRAEAEALLKIQPSATFPATTTTQPR